MSSRQSSSGSRVVFIGNIPFDITEEQLIDIFKEVGPVQSFRLMFDRETGRSRGYAFCEYADYETAASAMRNLNGYEINGRFLKVDRAENTDMLPSHFASASTGSSSMPANSSSQIRPVQNLPNVPQSISTATIHSVLSAPPFTDPQTLMEVLASLKETIQSNPNQARQMLASNPALSYALLQSFVALNLVDMSTVQSLLIQSQQAVQKESSVPSAPATGPQSAEQQRQLIMQIMNMTPEQINMLPPGQREQVLQLRQQIQQQQQQQRA